MRVDVDDLVDLNTIVDRFKELGKPVGKSAVTNWLMRHEDFRACEIEWAGQDTFPIFSWKKVRRWAIDTGRLPKESAA